MKDFFSANQRKALKLTNTSTHYDSETTRHYVVMITFTTDKFGEPIDYTMVASIAYCKKYCADLKAGKEVTPIKSSEMAYILR